MAWTRAHKYVGGDDDEFSRTNHSPAVADVCSLCGYPPFYADNAPALFKKIMDVKYDFDDSSWDDVSEDGTHSRRPRTPAARSLLLILVLCNNNNKNKPTAKNLIRHLLVKDPSQRYTAEQCLNDPWVKGNVVSDHVLETKDFMKRNQA